jgi:hypothetical protein
MHDHPIKHFIDWAAGTITVAALLSWIPHLTAVLAMAWWLIRIYETETVQRVIARWRK